MNATMVEFWVQTVAGIVGVFVGVWLALVTDRRRQSREETKSDLERQQQYARARHTVLGSVIKNANEASRLGPRVDKRKPFELIHTRFEVSVWEAIQIQFMQACHDIDERVRFAQFFDGVRVCVTSRLFLTSTVDYNSPLQALSTMMILSSLKSCKVRTGTFGTSWRISDSTVCC